MMVLSSCFKKDVNFITQSEEDHSLIYIENGIHVLVSKNGEGTSISILKNGKSQFQWTDGLDGIFNVTLKTNSHPIDIIDYNQDLLPDALLVKKGSDYRLYKIKYQLEETIDGPNRSRDMLFDINDLYKQIQLLEERKKEI